MKKVKSLGHFEYAGKEIQPGYQIWMHDHDALNYSSRGLVSVLITPENRDKK